MELIRGIYNLKPHHKKCVATIGNFDGVHLGHQKIIQQLIEKAKQLNLPSLVITFEPLPLEYFRGDAAPARLHRFSEKMQLLADLGVDRLLCLRFNKELANLSAEDFVTQLLHASLEVKWLIVGDDFHFGAQRQGDFKLLRQMSRRFNFQVSNTATCILNDQRVGSSHVRTALAQGNLALATTLLGYPYAITGRVIHGDQLGRQLGFPTANIPLKRRVIPLQGVYTVEVSGIGPQPLPGVANVGTRPTVKGIRSLLEVYLLNFNQNLYGKRLKVKFLHKLRDEKKFNSLEDLRAQIAEDVRIATTIMGT